MDLLIRQGLLAKFPESRVTGDWPRKTYVANFPEPRSG